jgi:hypothetical protein
VRTWFVVLIIALLPLRGWVGDAMAGHMVAHQLQAAQPAEAAHGHAAAHDCAGHDAAAAESAAAHDGDAMQPLAGDCPTCPACQACSAVALVFAAAGLGEEVFSLAPPPAGDPRFASAEPLRAHKPPIS